MNEKTLTPNHEVVMRPPSKRRRWLAVVLVCLVFLCGAVCGAGVTVVLVVRGVRQAIQQPERRLDRSAQWLARRLGLTPDQQEQVRQILRRQNADFVELRREVMPRVVSRLEQTEQEIAEVLDPEQREKWRRLADELKKKWLPARDPGH